jgi:UDP-N-acetyl-D-glucosamine dehydrogenase
VLAHAMDIDIWDVLDAAQTKPFGYQRFDPGIGPGGMCIPVNPHYLSFKASELDVETRVIELTGDINFAMAEYVRDRITAFHPVDGARVLCLGAAFKAGVRDVRNSRAVRVMELLEDAGAQVEFTDPLVHALTLHGAVHEAVDIDAASFGDFDLIVALVRNPVWPRDAVLGAGVPVFDAVNALAGEPSETYERL